jgi:uncharacterized protein YbgA (DUF1722 family)
LRPDVAHLQFLNRKAVEALVGDYRRGQSEEAARLVFAILLLKSWLTRFVDVSTRLSLT